MPSTSGSSDEIMSTAIPCPASSESKRCTSDFVPTSMPRVGSSMMSRSGLRESHFASTTFCWLPPERVEATVSSAFVLTSRRLAQMAAARFSMPVVMRPHFARRLRSASVTLRPTVSSITRPW